jgi:elongation factor Ts
VESYIHGGGKIGVLVEVNCETDFVARTDDFGRFVKDIAMQVAATSAQYVESHEIPSEVLEREKAIHVDGIKGKPAKVAEQIVEGKLKKFYKEICLLEQPFIKDDKFTINQLLTDLIAKTGENIRIRRFSKFILGA